MYTVYNTIMARKKRKLKATSTHPGRITIFKAMMVREDVKKIFDAQKGAKTTSDYLLYLLKLDV